MSNKLEKLTPEQEARMADYTAKWVAIGKDTVSLGLAETTEIIHNYQKLILKVNPTPVVVKDNPKEAWAFIQKHTNSDESFVFPYQDGSFSAHIFAFYDFFFTEGIVKMNPELQEKFKAWSDTAKLGLIYPLDDICVVTKKPKKIITDARGRLHCENGMALEYEGWGFYSLNGVTVPEYLVMTPAEELSMDFFKKETNADVKAEFVRKYGVERMLDLGKKIDSYENYDQEEQPWWWKSEYELWDMAVLFEGLEYQPYLKMKNQTTGIWHVEAVSPTCRTLKDAIKERFGGKEMKIVAIA
jgi:hypothetical protein